MEEFLRHMERVMLGAACRDAGLPEEITFLMDCLVKNGCPVKSVLSGLLEFGKTMSEKSDMEIDKDMLKILLKDLPIELEGE